MTTVLEATPVRRRQTRALPPVVDGPVTHGSASVLVVDADVRRRERVANALSTIPVSIRTSPSHADAYVQAHHTPVAVLVADGREDPRGAVDLIRRLRKTQPFLVAILIGIEWDRVALVEAINDIEVFKVLNSTCQEVDVRIAVLSGLQVERERREAARLNKPWLRGLLHKIEAALPSGALSDLDEKGGELPFDLVQRHVARP
jgi:DNA-binding NtrC family response regulator